MDKNHYTINQKFDEFGNYRHRIEVQTTSVQSINESVKNCVIYNMNKHLYENIQKDIKELSYIVLFRNNVDYFLYYAG